MRRFPAWALAGLDVGTSASKAAIFDEQGHELGEARAPLHWSRTAGGIETDPEAIWSCASQALAGVLGERPNLNVVALGVTGMAETGVLLDEDGHCLAPVIAWHDERDWQELNDLQEDLGASVFSATTGLPTWTQWSLTKHRWLRNHVPAVARAVRRLHLPEWVVWRLGGEAASEQSLASRTGWLDLASRRWWEESLAWSGLDVSLLAPLACAGTSLGVVRRPPAGLEALRGVTLTVAGHDHQAAAVGVGALGVGDEVNSSGTADALVRSIAPGLPAVAVLALTGAGITVGWHALADRWCLLGDSRGGLVLEQLGEKGFETAAESTAALHQSMAGVVGPSTRVIATGGWSRNQELLAIKQRLIGSVTASPVTEGGCRGAALFAGLAAGVYAGPDEFPPPAPGPQGP